MLEPLAGFTFSRQACAGDSHTSKRFVRIATLTIFTAIVFKSLVVAEVVELFLKTPNCQSVIEFFNSKYFEINWKSLIETNILVWLQAQPETQANGGTSDRHASSSLYTHSDDQTNTNGTPVDVFHI